MNVYVCKNCGLSEIEFKMWVNPNTREINFKVPSNNEEDYITDCFCKVCGAFDAGYTVMDENDYVKSLTISSYERLVLYFRFLVKKQRKEIKALKSEKKGETK